MKAEEEEEKKTEQIIFRGGNYRTLLSETLNGAKKSSFFCWRSRDHWSQQHTWVESPAPVLSNWTRGRYCGPWNQLVFIGEDLLTHFFSRNVGMKEIRPLFRKKHERLLRGGSFYPETRATLASAVNDLARRGGATTLSGLVTKSHLQETNKCMPRAIFPESPWQFSSIRLLPLQRGAALPRQQPLRIYYTAKWAW